MKCPRGVVPRGGVDEMDGDELDVAAFSQKRLFEYTSNIYVFIVVTQYNK